MIRTTAAPRTATRLTAAAALGLAGAFALAGCAGSDTDAATDTGTTDQTEDSGTTTETEDTATGSGAYTDGTYTAEGSYATPESVETISVTVTLADGGIIESVEVTGDPQKAESERYQGEFIGGISDVVVGESIDEISVSRVAGSSLTSGGFNDAIEVIKSEAAA